ncbi:MAG TPA: carbamoyltransferase HypF [Thermoanaerobaculia bacterium]|nr:carbamoyltransferase HypF [Thermoanaerobaculia bacterium]
MTSGGHALVAEQTSARSGLRVRGVVQGVGFRPFVYRLARQYGMSGFVRNDSGGVWIEIEGRHAILAEFPDLLRRQAPAAAVIQAIESFPLPLKFDGNFSVIESAATPGNRARIPCDLATCSYCLQELFDPMNRRYLYPFINCTACGPRFSIVRDTPYDRARTTMDAFSLCAACLDEYQSPADRRFHAEPNACAVCGPRLQFVSSRPEENTPLSDSTNREALARAVALLQKGLIVAIKGLGGFHLAVDATNDVAVRRLRDRKQRPHKPFAVMARDAIMASTIAEVGESEARLLTSVQRPIVLLPARKSALPNSIAPASDEIGVMLPYTPLHHLLLDALPLLVMTSGNRADEPIVIDNDVAIEQLSGIADAFLLHDREIHARVDDSVTRVANGTRRMLRRSRGFVPDPIELQLPVRHAAERQGQPFPSDNEDNVPSAGPTPSILAVGAELKNTLCITRGSEAFLSQHIGDLESPESLEFFKETTTRLSRLLSVTPAVVAHDLHPDYASTRWALASGLRRIPVQHHHAHIASCLAENGRSERVIGVAFDGTGCGPAGELWGGEFLLADARNSERVGHLRPLGLIGGTAAIREPWRLAVAALDDAGEETDILRDIDPYRREMVLSMSRKGIRTVRSTSAGRWFDAVAALCAVREEITYEAQAAIELEALASRDDVEPYSFTLTEDAVFEVDLRPAIREIVGDLRAGLATAIISSRFHQTMASLISAGAVAARSRGGPAIIALSGGCFQNRLLSERARTLLERDGFEVLQHRHVPANDGGIALGQAFVAAHLLASETGYDAS